MINIPIGVNEETETDITVSSNEVTAVIFPCSDFEALILYQDLKSRYNFAESELTPPQMTRPLFVDLIKSGEETKVMTVNIWCWKISDRWLCFIEPASDYFSRTLVGAWLANHFPCCYSKDSPGDIFEPINFRNCIPLFRAV